MAYHGQQDTGETSRRTVRRAKKQGIVFGLGLGFVLGYDVFFEVLYRIPVTWSSVGLLASTVAAGLTLIGVTVSTAFGFVAIEWVMGQGE